MAGTKKEKEFSYALRRSARARHLRIAVTCAGEVKVTAPRRLPESAIARFIAGRADWVREALRKFAAWPDWKKRPRSRRDYLEHKEQARTLVLERLAFWSARYGLAWKNVSIRDQRSRWGSCSRQGNLSFNYKIVFLPERLQNYLIVHELCHLGEFNHSSRFWALVARVVPDWKKCRRELR